VFYIILILFLISKPKINILLQQIGEDNWGADDEGQGGLPRWAIPLMISALFFTITAIFGSLQRPPRFYDIHVVLGLLTSILWISAEANEVVGLLTALGIFWQIDQAVMGLTFLAWANSVGDLVADISLSRIGKARTAVSNELR